MNHYEPMPPLDDGFDLAGLKVPPHSIEAEQSVIGGLIIGGDFDAVAEIVTGEDFYRPDHRLIFEAIARLAEQGTPIDYRTVLDELQAAGHGDRIDPLYVFEMAKDTPSSANVRAYAAAVRERAVLRNLIRVGQQIAESGFEPDGRKAAELIDEAQAAVIELGEKGGAEQDIHCSSRLRGLMDEWERRHNAGGMIGLSTGFAELDKRTSGLQAGDMIILAARPSMGKTSLAMNIAENVAVVQGKAVLVFSMEMSAEQLLDRMASSVGRIPYELIRTGQAFESSEHDFKLAPTVSRIKSSPLYIDDRAALSIQQMRTTARKLHKKCPLSLIVVDYLQLAKAKAESRVMEVTAISQGLKALAKELRVPMLVLSQLNRGVESRNGNKRPGNSDLRDSGAIEQDADVILMIYRDEVYDEQSPDRGMAEIICTKQRNGPTGTDRLASNLHMCRFDNLAREWQPREIPAVDRKTKSTGGFNG